jgi:hypothetical protein
VSDIDTGVVDSLKALDLDGRLEKRTNGRRLAESALCQKRTYAPQQNKCVNRSRRQRMRAVWLELKRREFNLV